jgi:chemotaxis protein CheD
MTHSTPSYEAVYLKPGELYIGQTSAMVTTVLGSCISVTMFHRQSRVAAICHAIMPTWREQTRSIFNGAEKYRYVNLIIPEMIRKIMQHGARLKEIEVKLFGGSDTFNDGINAARIQSVGSQNAAAAVKTIESIGLRFKVANTGGPWGRKIIFCTRTGEVLMKYLK